jgi:type I restriction enzyme R subunit
VNALPESIRSNPGATAEVIENNVRKLIIDEHPINPKYYEKMSELLSALIAQRKQAALDYKTYLERIVALTKQIAQPTVGTAYPKPLDAPAKRALYDNLAQDEALALAVDAAIRANRQDEWRANPLKTKKVRLAIRAVIETHPTFARPTAGGRIGSNPHPPYSGPESTEEVVTRLLELAKNQHEY